MTVAVGVHGVGNHMPEHSPQEASARLSAIWSNALARGDFDLTVAYYAHHLRKSVAQGDEDDPDTLDGESAGMLAQWADELLEPEDDQGWLTVPPKQIIGRLASYGPSGHLLGAFAVLFVREVQRYLGKRHQDRRIKARDEVAAVIRDRGASVVIAHSLGSVVAYEALCAHPDLDIDLLVTLGSPLAIRGMVLDRLDPRPGPDRPLPRPPGVRRWVNLADPGDVVAVPRRLGKVFHLDEDCEETIGLLNFHGVARYLASPKLKSMLGLG